MECRVGLGDFTPSRSQNRTRASRLIRLLPASRWSQPQAPVVEQIAIARGDRPQPAICFTPSAPESLVFPHRPSHLGFGEVVAQNIQTLRAIETPVVGYPGTDCRIEPLRPVGQR